MERIIVTKIQPKFHQDSIRAQVYAKAKRKGGAVVENVLKVDGAQQALRYLVARKYVRVVG